MKLDLTPWARKDIDPVIRELLSGMEPRKGTVHIGRAMRDWRAVVTYRGWVLAEARGETATEAGENVIRRMSTPDADVPDPTDFGSQVIANAAGIEVAYKAHDDIPDPAVWRGVEIEVVDP